jgi:hypothetical protein
MQASNDPDVPLTKPDQAPQLNARRRLLRGTFAAPTLLTLSSGSALAQSSSLRCFRNMPAGLDNPPANFFTVPRYTHLASGGTTTKVVKAADINSVGTVNGFNASTYTSGKTWIKVSDGASFTPSSGSFAADTGKTVALRFQNFGTETAPNLRITGLAKSAASTSGPIEGKVLSSSCWSSFK